MKRIVLERLTLNNFKGIKNLVLAANGGDADVYGDNATGKTTMFDGFVWLLFGKDSQNKADFEIKGLDGAGKVLQHKLEHEVEEYSSSMVDVVPFEGSSRRTGPRSVVP